MGSGQPATVFAALLDHFAEESRPLSLVCHFYPLQIAPVIPIACVVFVMFSVSTLSVAPAFFALSHSLPDGAFLRLFLVGHTALSCP